MFTDRWTSFLVSLKTPKSIKNINLRCSTTLDEEGVQTDSQERTDDEPNNIPAIVKRWVQDDKLIITEECDDIMSRRTFTRVIDNE